MKKNLIIFVLLSACAVGPDYVEPDFFDEAEIQNSVGLNNVEEVSEKDVFSPYEFNDVDLNSLMDKVQEDSPSIQVAILKLKQARDALKKKKKNSFPMFDVNDKYNFVNESDNMGMLLDSDYYQAGLDMSWEIDIFGGNRRKNEVSKAKFMSMLYNLKNVNVSLVSEVAMTYINFRNAQQQLKNAMENLQIQEEGYSIILDQYNVDLTDEITLSQSKYLVETTKMQIPELEHQVDRYLSTLSVLLGELPGSLNELLLADDENNLIQKPFEYDLNKLYNLPISIIRNRPDIKMIEQELIAQNAEIGVAISQLYPSFSLSGFLGFESTEWHNLFDKHSFTNSLIPGFTFPLFNWGQLRNNINIQKYLKEETLVNYKSSILKAVAEVRDAIIAIEKEYQINKSATKAYNNMALVSELNWKKYRLGLISYNNVLDSEQRRLSAQTDMVNSNANLYKYLITFYKSIGGRPTKIEHTTEKGEN